MMLLAGDIGGTKTILALYSLERGLRAPIETKKFASADYSSLEAMIGDFLVSADERPAAACFGVAGPVVAGRAKITNLPWVVETSKLQKRFHLTSVELLNDLQAVAYALPHLQDEDIRVLQTGLADPQGTRAVIAPGTGLGEAFSVWAGSKYKAYGSEGGHADFAPANSLEVELLQYLSKQYEHVSYERVCSGIGIPVLYEFLRSSGHEPEPDWLRAKLAAVKDRTPLIVGNALNQQSELCVKSLDLFVSILGAAAGNLGLHTLATGGVYLGGGIPPRILPTLQAGPFLHAFVSKGRMSDLMKKMPVKVILNPQSALLGAAARGLELLRSD